MRPLHLAIAHLLLISLSSLFVSAASAREQEPSVPTDTPLTEDQFHDKVCAISPYQSDDPWHITNLYNCVSRELFIPYQLWTGALWNGDKQQDCVHQVNQQSTLIPAGKHYASGRLILRGPITWTSPATQKVHQVWERIRPDVNSHRYYACHSRGIGAIHNVKREKVVFIPDLCHAPGGFGWKINQQRTCVKTTIKIVDINLSATNHIESLSYDYWFRDKLRYRYLLKPNQGVTQIYYYKR